VNDGKCWDIFLTAFIWSRRFTVFYGVLVRGDIRRDVNSKGAENGDGVGMVKSRIVSIRSVINSSCDIFISIINY